MNHSRRVTNLFHWAGKREPLNGRWVRNGDHRWLFALIHMGPAQDTFEHLPIGSEQVNLVLERANSVSVPSNTALRNVDKVLYKNICFSMFQCCGAGSCEMPPGACETVSELETFPADMLR